MRISTNALYILGAAVLLLFVMVCVASGQATPPAATPTIPDADKLAFFEAQAAFNEAQAKIQAAGKKLADDCGKDHVPSLEKGLITCVTPPTPSSTVPKK
jgi:hypothetical protein